jgi:hypothetical protein
MKQKQIFIVLGALGVVFLVFWFFALTLAVKTLRGSLNKDVETQVAEVTLCDENASDLCVVTFGANSLNRMVIYFQLPSADYVPFYVKADNRGTVNVYSCEVDENILTSVYCTGVRTPLGETIDVEVYTTAENKLVGRGTFLILAIALSTPASQPLEGSIQEPVPTSIPAPGEFIFPTESAEPFPKIPTPEDPAYPNP